MDEWSVMVWYNPGPTLPNREQFVRFRYTLGVSNFEMWSGFEGPDGNLRSLVYVPTDEMVAYKNTDSTGLPTNTWTYAAVTVNIKAGAGEAVANSLGPILTSC